MSVVLSVKYSMLSGLVVVPDNRETRTSFPLVKRLNLSVLFVTCDPCITHSQGRINRCAGCAMAGPAYQLPNFYHAVLTFQRLNVMTTNRKSSSTFCGKKSALPEKKMHAQRKSWLRVWEKSPRLTLVWGPRTVNPALRTALEVGRYGTAYRWIILHHVAYLYAT